MYEKLSNSPFLTLQLDYSAIYLILLCEHTDDFHSTIVLMILSIVVTILIAYINQSKK